MDNNLGNLKYDFINKDANNIGNAHSKKIITSDFGKKDLKVPR